MLPVVPVAATAVALRGFAPVASAPGGGRLLAGTYPGTERPGLLYLPPHFRSGRRYRVVYLLHGMRGSPTEFVAGAGLTRFAAAALAAGAIRPFIAVLPAAGPSRAYNGEWAGRWEDALVRQIVPWVDAHLPTVRGPTGRIIAGLSAGGFGAVDIGLRHPDVFGTVESWGGYFQPLPDGPFRHASTTLLRAHDPMLLASAEAPVLRRDRTAFFLSTGPSHSHWFTADATFAFARELQALRLPVTAMAYPQAQGEWRAQLERGLAWALAGRQTSGAAAASAADGGTPTH